MNSSEKYHNHRNNSKRRRTVFICLLTLISAAFVCNISMAKNPRVTSGVLKIFHDPANRIPPVPISGETFTSATLDVGVRIAFQKPAPVTTTSSHLTLYLLPNGSTIEQALGRTSGSRVSWRYGGQHIAAQTRRVNDLMKPATITTALLEADTLSWPAWRRATPGSDKTIRHIVEQLRRQSGNNSAVDLVAHSGGGSFIWGYLNAYDSIPDYVQHIAFLDANYSYSDADHHGDKLLAWLKRDTKHRLVVMAYDDRFVLYNGKRIVSDTGGTWRATDRMARYFDRTLDFTAGRLNDLETSTALNGRLIFARHPNPKNIILHTVIVEKNGFVFSVAEGRTPLSPGDLPFADHENYRKLITP